GEDRWRDGPPGDAAAAAGRAHQRDPGPGAQVLEREDRRTPRDRGGRMNVAVLGASHGGFTVAADLALAGHAVRLWARSAQALGPLAGDPTIALAAEGAREPRGSRGPRPISARRSRAPRSSSLRFPRRVMTS